MPYYDDDLDEEDDFDDELYDAEDDEVELTDCPLCGAEIYAESEQCPACGSYIVHETHWRQNRPWWFVALGGLGILAVLWILIYPALEGVFAR